MPRYVSLARKQKAFDDDWYEAPLEPALTVIENDPIPTGLLDAKGNDIYRMNDPMGFQFD